MDGFIRKKIRPRIRVVKWDTGLALFHYFGIAENKWQRDTSGALQVVWWHGEIPVSDAPGHIRLRLAPNGSDVTAALTQ